MIDIEATELFSLGNVCGCRLCQPWYCEFSELHECAPSWTGYITT